MKLISDVVSLVVAGAWNPYVLQPSWVLERIPGVRRAEEQPLTTEFAVGAVDSPRFIFPGILKFHVLKTSLVLSPEQVDQAGLERIAETAGNILRDLRHTPVTGVGYNFQFDADDAASAADQLRIAQRDVVDALSGEFQVVSNGIRTSLNRDGLLLNVSKEFQAGKLSLKYNFHHGALSTQRAAEIIDQQPMWAAYQESLRISEEIFGEELSDDQ